MSLLSCEGLRVHHPGPGRRLGAAGVIRAVDGVSLSLARGEILGLVGESGCGKSTLARALLRLLPITSGRVVFDGLDLTHLSPARLRPLRRRLQIVLQDPFASLDPRMTVAEAVGEGLAIHRLARGAALRIRVAELLERVGLGPELLDRHPHRLSGGQRQRVALARALAVSPEVIVADEPVSALDVSVQAQVLGLLRALQSELSLTWLVISHDLRVVRHLSERVAIMYLGRIVEVGPTAEVFERPAHPYTRALLSAIPALGARRLGDRIVLPGEVPSALEPPSGCAFHPRCAQAFERCRRERPEPGARGPGHEAACFLPDAPARGAGGAA